MKSIIGQPVFLPWGETLRFGNIIEERMEENIRYVKVNWKNDEEFETAKAWDLEMSGDNARRYGEWHKITKLFQFERERFLSTIQKL